jgi:tetratricopeptide (TPR) repeat protein
MKLIVTSCLAISLSLCVASAQPSQLSEASQHIRAADYAGARRILEAQIAQTPQLPEAHNLLGVCLRELKDPVAAVAQFRLVIKLEPGYENAWLNLGSTLFSLKDETGAIAVFDRLIKMNPRSIAGHLSLAKIKLAHSDDLAALQSLEKVIELDPHSTFALANAGLIESRQGKLDSASNYISRALGEDPQSQPLQLALLELYLKLGRTTEAQPLLDNVTKHAALTPDRKQTLATLLLNSGLAEKGAQLINGDSSLGERFADAAMARAKHKFSENNFRETASILEAIQSLRTQDAELHHLLGLAYYEMGDTRKASDELQQAIKLEPRNPDRYIHLGLVYLKHHTPDLAQVVFEHGLAQVPDSALLWLWLGLSQHLADNSIQAQQSVQKALGIDPGLVEGYVVLGDILESDGRLSEASEVFQQAILKKPDLSIGYYYCGKVALENGDGQTEQALTFLTKAVELNPDFADAHYERGLALEHTGKLRQAVDEYRGSLTKNPNLPQAHYRLALLYRKLGQTRTADHEFVLFQQTKRIEKDTVLERLEYRIRQP